MIYFIATEARDLIKIGSADDPWTRYLTLRSISPVPLVLVAMMDGGKPEERELHERFRLLRHHGEWFKADAELLNFIASAAVPWEAPLTNGARRYVRFRCRPAFKRWIEDAAEEERTTESDFITRCLVDFAAFRGYPAPPRR
jgi:hypothetical protein